ncbi:hypothetical protein ACFE04_001965 [Oxalis oulophora]
MIRRLLLRCLRPWLIADPEFHVIKLGFINSIIIIKNLQLNTSPLNELLLQDSNLFLFFKDVTIDSFTFSFSNWHVPAFHIEIHGLNITLSAREVEGGRVFRKSNHDDEERKKQRLAEIDPQGSALHGVLEELLMKKPSRNWFITSLVNTVVKYSRLRIDNVSLQGQFPTIDESVTYMLDVEELNVEPQHFEHKCLFRGIVCAAILPSKQGSFVVDGSGIEFGYKKSEEFNCICYSDEILTCFEMNQLQIMGFELRVPEIVFLFSPLDLPILSGLSKLSYEALRLAPRNGKELWKLATRKMYCIVPVPRLTLNNLVDSVYQWIHYVKSYEALMSLLEYSLEKGDHKIYIKKRFLGAAKHNWKVIADIEKQLPVDSIAQARRIARCRAQNTEASNWESFFKIFLFFTFIWKVIKRIFSSIVQVFSLFNRESKKSGHPAIRFQNSPPQNYFIVNLGKILVTVRPGQAIEPFDKQVDSHVGILSFCLSVDSLLLIYIKGILEKSVLISCGKFTVNSLSFTGSPTRVTESKIRQGKVNNFETVLWSEPAQIFSPSESNLAENVDVACLQTFLGEMSLNWNRICVSLKESDFEYYENPFLLCESKSLLTNSGLKHFDSGFLKSSLTVGKLNLSVGYESIFSMALLLSQIEHAIHWSDDEKHAKVVSGTPETSLDKYESYCNGMKMTLLKIHPEKHIQIGVFIVGPNIQVSLRKVGFEKGHDEFRLAFDVHNIELAIWPYSEPGDTTSHNVEMQISQINKTATLNNEKFTSHARVCSRSYLRVNGLTASLSEKQFLAFGATYVKLLSFRDSVHSFSSNVTDISTALDGVATGFNFISYMDEWYAFFQLLEGSYSAVSNALSGIHSTGALPVKEQNVVSTESENEGNTDGLSYICNTVLFLTKGSFEIKSVEIILSNSRKDMKNSVEISHNNTFGVKILDDRDLLDCGLWISIHKTCLEVSFEGRKLDVLMDLSGIHMALLRSHELKGSNFDLPCSHDCFCELSLSNCVFTLWLCPLWSASSSMLATSAGDSRDHTAQNSPTNNVLHNFVQKKPLGFNILPTTPGHWMLINVSLGEVVLARTTVKNCLNGAHLHNKLLTSLSVGGEFQKFFWNIQGGTLFLEMTGMVMLIQCITSYFERIRYLVSIVQPSIEDRELPKHDMDMGELNNGFSEDFPQETPLISQQANFEYFTIDVSEFSVILVDEQESGGIWELVLEIDVHMKLGSGNMRRTFIFNLSRFSIFSQFLQASIKDEMQIPHFSYVTSVASQDIDTNCPVSGASCSSSPLSQNAFSVDSCMPRDFYLTHKNDMLKHLAASISVAMPETSLQSHQAWVGSGSVSGFDMQISLSELQIILAMMSSFSGISSKKVDREVKLGREKNKQGTDTSSVPVIPDGAIVAIQDVHQHMYFAVEGGENKYTLAGVFHYSLVGEKALFKVKYTNRKPWKSSLCWFSLISLHAKDKLGKPLRLNFHQGSGFVNISSNNDSWGALWRAVVCEPESYKIDDELEPYDQLVRNTFYLVNKKNDCAVAFIDGIPEFVKKPGHPIKFKVFHDYVIPHDEEGALTRGENLPCIDIKIEKISLTILDELPKTKDRFQLLHGCMSEIQLILLVLPSKARVICTSRASFSYFHTQRNTWKELIRPVDICIFYRYNLQRGHSQTVLQKVPAHFYCRAGQVEVSLTELSLDILLFVVGKLDLAGPFLVKSSMIQANYCKIVNQTGLGLHCQFYNEQSIEVGSKQSVPVYLRHSALTDSPPAISPTVSIKLSVPGSLTTSLIEFSILKLGAFAWRTRLVSIEDSRTYPGPLIVVDVSKKSEDGLSIVVSPLVRIHNETDYSMETRFLRPEQSNNEWASMPLKAGDTIDDSIATFDAITLSGSIKKALMSLSVGNFLFSFRPGIPEAFLNSEAPLLVEWSNEVEGGKAVRLSGIFDNLSYRVRKALSVETMKCSFSTAHCMLKCQDKNVATLHFLIQCIERDVPIKQPDIDSHESRNLPVALQKQKEIFLLPTVRLKNLLHSEIHVLLSETDGYNNVGHNSIGKKGIIRRGETVNFYVNPAIMFLTVILTAHGSSCRPVSSSDWAKKLLKDKNDVQYLDICLDFGGGKYFALLRLSRGPKGILEGAIYTSFTLNNHTDFTLYLFAPHQKPPSRDELQCSGSVVPPDLGLLLPPQSSGSWFLKSHKVQLKLLEDYASEAMLDLEALSGLTEINLETHEGYGVNYITKLGVSMGPSASNNMSTPSRTVTIVPRHVVFNESDDVIVVRQCHLQDDAAGMIINSKQRKTLQLRNEISKRRKYSVFENLIRHHKNEIDNSLRHVQFQIYDRDLSWSGPLCIASLGHFFLKFRKLNPPENSTPEFAAVHVVEDGSTLVVHFHKPSNITLPYRIENCIPGSSIAYYQKDCSQSETLGPGCSADYVWDDLTLPHKLVVLIGGMNLLREINLDKVRAWKPFSKLAQFRGLTSFLNLEKKSGDQMANFDEFNAIEMVNVGYEVYAEGPTRVLRICEFLNCHKEDSFIQSRAKIQIRVSQFALHLLEHLKQDSNESETPAYTPIAIARLGNITLDILSTSRQKFNQFGIQSINVDEKWLGAPFAAILRRHQLDSKDFNDGLVLYLIVLDFTYDKTIAGKQIIGILNPLDLNLDEETLMRFASFWRTSLSKSTSPSRQYYFDHFEIHPIKIVASFLPGDSYSSYNSSQETLRSLLHSVIKVPPTKNMVVELNGVLVTHALITTRELLLRCAQHYSWYSMRAVYIAKGSTLLPPAFASIFDDLASSSLDVFFDPSKGLMNLPGITIGTLKLVSECIHGGGFSGTKRYFGDLGNTLRTAGSNVLFAAITEVSDSVLKGAETNGFDGMLRGFHQGILNLAMEPSLLGTALMGGGPDRKIKLDQSPGVDELYIEGYLQAMLDTMYRQEYLRVRVIDDQVILKNLPPNSTLTNEIIDRVKGFLISKALLKGDPSTSRPLRHLQGDSEWKLGPTILTLCEHLFVSFAIRLLRKQSGNITGRLKKTNSDNSVPKESKSNDERAVVLARPARDERKVRLMWKWGIAKFVMSGILAYVDGRLCRRIPNPVARRIVSGFLLSFLDKDDGQ